MKSLEELRKKLEQAKDEEKIDILIEMGKIYSKNNRDVARARDLFDKALQLSEQSNDTKNIANCKHQLGISYWSGGDINTARTYFLEAEELFQEVDDKVKIASLQMCVGVTYMNSGDLQRAITKLRQGAVQALLLRDKELSSMIFELK